jgi:2-dehydro-3-deoxygalactonokinase
MDRSKETGQHLPVDPAGHENGDARSKGLYAAVDWGTTSFRLWIIGPDGRILAERRSADGMTTAREKGFSAVLEAQLADCGAATDLPVIICGMAGARQGWREAGYIDVPTRLDRLHSGAVRIDGETRDIRILPGLDQTGIDADVMRGEETQLLGCLARLPAGASLVAMPGTHCKWVRVESGVVTGFSTFMTGELFAAISQYTILAHAIGGSGGFGPDSPAFLDAVERAAREPGRLSTLMFSIRARGLLQGLSPEDAEATLSGLIIGLEIAGARRPEDSSTPVHLVASGRLAALYRSALGRLGIDVHPIDADMAVLDGLRQAADAIWRPERGQLRHAR